MCLKCLFGGVAQTLLTRPAAPDPIARSQTNSGVTKPHIAALAQGPKDPIAWAC